MDLVLWEVLERDSYVIYNADEEPVYIAKGTVLMGNSIKIVLPLFEKDANLTEDEKVIYTLLSKTMLKPISEIAPYVSFGKSKTTKLLKDMGEKGVIAIEGKGRGTKYIIK